MTQPKSDLERIHTLETDVTILHKDSALHTKTFEKIEDVIDKLETHNEALSRTVGIYDEKLKNQEKTNDRIEDSIQDIKSCISLLEDKIEIQNSRNMVFFEQMKLDLLKKIENHKENMDDKMAKSEDTSSDRKQFKVFKLVVDNWKYLVFVVSLMVGLVFNKWGILKSILTGG